MGQRTEQRTPEWHAARVGRVTASNSGAILGIDPNRQDDDVLREMVRAYHGFEPEFNGNIATEYGTLHEPLAKMDYAAKTGIFPEDCGFFEYGDWLGASPDGLIGDDGLLEIKCPFGLRNDNKPVFKTSAEQPHYYAQMQIQMQCTGRKWCDFYQWSKHGDRIDRVYYDPFWLSKNIPLLINFWERYKSELDNPVHLEPLRKSMDEAFTLVEEYRELQAKIEEATARKKEIIAELVELSGGKDSDIAGHKLTKVVRKGAVDYGAVPELEGVDLEQYRKAPSEYWSLK